MERTRETLPTRHSPRPAAAASDSPQAWRPALGWALRSLLPPVPPPCLRQELRGLQERRGLQPRCCLRGTSGCGGAPAPVSGVPWGTGLGTACAWGWAVPASLPEPGAEGKLQELCQQQVCLCACVCELECCFHCPEAPRFTGGRGTTLPARGSWWCQGPACWEQPFLCCWSWYRGGPGWNTEQFMHWRGTGAAAGAPDPLVLGFQR